jgi:hypothetical protein
MDASELDPAVIALVERLRTPTESIWNCIGKPSEAVSVYLIEEENRPYFEAMRSTGLPAGGGRVLQFVYQNGEWRLTEENEYIC